MKSNINVQVIKHKIKSDSITFKITDEQKLFLLKERDKLINDKIYMNPTDLLIMKIKFNKSVKAEFKEFLFDMSKCDIAVAKAIENFKIEQDIQFKVQEAKFKAQEEIFKVQEAKFKAQEEKYKAQEMKFNEQLELRLRELSNKLSEQIELNKQLNKK